MSETKINAALDNLRRHSQAAHLRSFLERNLELDANAYTRSSTGGITEREHAAMTAIRALFGETNDQ